MNMNNFKRRITLVSVFLVISLIFFIILSEDIFSYVILTNLPSLQDKKLLIIHLIANSLLFLSKLFIGIMMLRVYERLKSREIPFLGYVWIFAVWLVLASLIFAMNIISIYRVYIWVDGLVRISAGIFGVAAWFSFLKGYKVMMEMKTPEEFRVLAEEIRALRLENEALQKILNHPKTK